MRVLVVSFFTRGNGYEAEAQKLRASLGELLIPGELTIYEPFASWDEAVRYKPTFILEKLMHHYPDEYDGILWTDADSIFRSVPNWSKLQGVDLAWHRFKRGPHHEVEHLTGTMYFKTGSERVQEFVELWEHRTAMLRRIDCPEQVALRDLWNNKAHTYRDLSWRDIGPEMVYIFDDFKEHYPNVKPVIEHYQASRRLKGKVSK